MSAAAIRFRKTDAGQAELRTRSAGLSLRERAVLILCDGLRTVDDLSAHSGQAAAEVVARLMRLGLVIAQPLPGAAETAPAPSAQAARPPEPVSMPSPVAAPVAAETTPPTTPAAPEAVGPADWAAQRDRGLAVLSRLWGPGGGDRAAALRQVTEPAALAPALAQLQDALTAFQGRKRAAAWMRHVREGGPLP